MYSLDGGIKKFEESIRFFQDELTKLRTGRATPALVEHITVEAYGTKSPLIQLASITAPDPRTIIIQPWDKNIIRDVEKAISVSDINISPVVDGVAVRLSLPALNEENRRNLTKLLHQMAEACRVSLRQQREKIKTDIESHEEDGDITEDQKFKLQKKLDELIADYNAKIKELADKKEAEIMTI